MKPAAPVTTTFTPASSAGPRAAGAGRPRRSTGGVGGRARGQRPVRALRGGPRSRRPRARPAEAASAGADLQHVVVERRAAGSARWASMTGRRRPSRLELAVRAGRARAAGRCGPPRTRRSTRRARRRPSGPSRRTARARVDVDRAQRAGLEAAGAPPPRVAAAEDRVAGHEHLGARVHERSARCPASTPPSTSIARTGRGAAICRGAGGSCRGCRAGSSGRRSRGSRTSRARSPARAGSPRVLARGVAGFSATPGLHAARSRRWATVALQVGHGLHVEADPARRPRPRRRPRSGRRSRSSEWQSRGSGVALRSAFTTGGPDRDVGHEVAVHHVHVDERRRPPRSARARSPRPGGRSPRQRMEGARIIGATLLMSRLTGASRAHAVARRRDLAEDDARRHARIGPVAHLGRPSSPRAAGASRTSSGPSADQVRHHVVPALRPAAHQERRALRPGRRSPRRRVLHQDRPSRRGVVSPPTTRPTGTCACSRLEPRRCAGCRPRPTGTVRRRGPRLAQTRMLRWLLSVEPGRRLLATIRSAGHLGRRSGGPPRATAAAAGPPAGPGFGDPLLQQAGTVTSWDVSEDPHGGERADARGGRQ